MNSQKPDQSLTQSIVSDNKKQKSNAPFAKILWDTCKQDMLKNYIEGIVGFPNIVNLLNRWCERDKIYSLRKKSNIYAENYLPEIIVLTGLGPRYRMSKHIAQYCRKSGFLNTDKINTYNIYNFISHYVTDAEKQVTKAFEDSRSTLLYFTGFDLLIKNPRPPIADWHYWDDILLGMVQKYINRTNCRAPVILSMNKSTYLTINKRYNLFKNNDTLVIDSPYPSCGELDFLINQELSLDGYYVNIAAREKLSHLIQEIYDFKNLRKIDYFDIENALLKRIVRNQEERLLDPKKDSLTLKRVKNIISSDIPTRYSLSEEIVIFY